jgi:CBS domain-containing protein
MRVRDIMSSPVITVRSDTPIKVVAETLVSRNISAVPVVDREGKMVGIVSEADLVPLETVPDPRLHALPLPLPRQAMPWTARQVMTSEVVCLPEDADAASAAKLMLERGVKRIPIVSEGRVVGIVGRHDLLKVLARPDEDVLSEIEKSLDEEAGLIGHYKVVISDGHVTLVGPTEPRVAHLAERIVRCVPGVVDVELVGSPLRAQSVGPDR